MHTRLFLCFLGVTAGLAAADVHTLLVQYCGLCHGNEAGGSERGPPLIDSRRLRTRTEADIARIIRAGSPAGMPPVALPDDQINQIAAYVRSLNLTAFEAQPPG